MLKFRDFEPNVINEAGFFRAADYESMSEVMGHVNQWIDAERVNIVNVETVVLPNIRNAGEEGTTDLEIRTSGDMSSHWYQFVRVWYHD